MAKLDFISQSASSGVGGSYSLPFGGDPPGGYALVAHGNGAASGITGLTSFQDARAQLTVPIAGKLRALSWRQESAVPADWWIKVNNDAPYVIPGSGNSGFAVLNGTPVVAGDLIAIVTDNSLPAPGPCAVDIYIGP